MKITGMNPEELEAAERGENVEHKPGLLEQLEGADSGKDTPQPIEGDGPVDPEVIERAYYNQPVWKRIAVIAAGPVVNIVLAFVLLFAVYLSLPVPDGIQVESVQAGTPAAGVLKPGDRLLAVDGARATIPDLSKIDDANRRINVANDKFAHITNVIRGHHCAGGRSPNCRSKAPVTVKVERDGKVRTLPDPDLLRPRPSPLPARHRVQGGRDCHRPPVPDRGRAPGGGQDVVRHLADALGDRPDLRARRSGSRSRAWSAARRRSIRRSASTPTRGSSFSP